jgi:hypothetical protein
MTGSLRTPGYIDVLEHYGYWVSHGTSDEMFYVYCMRNVVPLVATFTTYDDNVFRLGSIAGGSTDLQTFVEFAYELAERAKSETTTAGLA